MKPSTTIKAERIFAKPTSIPQVLKCTICTQVFQSPVRLYCSHTFCHICINGWKKNKNQCPVCRIIIDQKNIGKDIIAQNIINQLQVLCPIDQCIWKGPNQFLDYHYEFQCQMRDILQNNNGKKKKTQKKIFEMSKDQSLIQKINQNTMKGSLQARVLAKFQSKNFQRKMIRSEQNINIKKQQKKQEAKNQSKTADTFDFLDSLF